MSGEALEAEQREQAPTGPPWREHEAELGVWRLAWRRAGTGPAVLYLHDAGGDTLASPALDDLAADHDLVVVDLPGYGRSGDPVGLDHVDRVVELLAALLDHLGWEAATVAGTSLGGWFALELALAAPTRVTGLLLADAAGLHLPEDYLLALFSRGQAAAGTERLVEAALVARLGAQGEGVAQMPPALAAATVGPVVTDLAAAAASSWDPYLLNPRLLGRLRGVRCPTTVLWGERDALIPMSHGRALAAGIPQARLVVRLETGHLVALEEPEAFAAELRALTAGA